MGGWKHVILTTPLNVSCLMLTVTTPTCQIHNSMEATLSLVQLINT